MPSKVLLTVKCGPNSVTVIGDTYTELQVGQFDTPSYEFPFKPKAVWPISKSGTTVCDPLSYEVISPINMAASTHFD